MTITRILLSSALVVASVGCRMPADEPTAPTAEPTASPAIAPSELVPAERTADPDPQALQEALDASLRMPVEVLAQEAIPRVREPFADIVLFRVVEHDYCRVHLYPDDRQLCDFAPSEGGVPGELTSRLGLALVEFERPAAPTVAEFRFLATGDDPTGSSAASPGREPVGQPPRRLIRRGNGVLAPRVESTSVEDVDGDGEAELVLVIAYTAPDEELMFDADELDMDSAYWEASEQVQLLVIRDDLSLQHGQIVENNYISSGGRTSAEPHLFGAHEVVRAGGDGEPGIRVEWCEVGLIVNESSSDCELEVLCATPTARLWFAYDAESDTYVGSEVERLRAKIDGGLEDASACP